MKTILITGCSSGIGYHVAIGLRQRGYRVIASARQQQDVDRLKQQGLEAIQLDLEHSESIQQAMDWVEAETGGELYALFNNGAYGQPGAIEDLSRDVLRQQLEINLLGWHELTCRVLPLMRRQGFGRIIQNSSVLGLIAMRFRGAYNTSKFALEGYTDTLRQELTGTGIHLSLIEPGPVTSQFRANGLKAFKANIDVEASPFRKSYKKVLQRLSTEDKGQDPFTLGPEAVLDKVIHALESKRPKARYYVTFPTYLFGFLRRVLSTRMLDWILLKASSVENK
ncbi:SDR family oxidoreductase [Amphritea sp. 2_MG-2023]|uniref:SDR family oxidoreductase n=1 Tax=Amphritea TaxID=515417 RepID=UPI001C06E4FE|nr:MULTISPECIES: SDR family oxidoreductase [Amphritea]MBU2966738.1 SDR family oxidoreductase [Amphritea atlantica]MDO6417402.1 SDR family oxidoreductase [Amphritea sp. 2_MG-2023]